MKQRKLIQLIALGLVPVIMITGCSSTRKPTTSRRMERANSGDAHVAVVEDRIRFYGKNISPTQEKALLADNVIYFGYDRYDVNDDDLLAIYAHAKYLIDHPNTRVRIEGHTDERGSPAYNVALGERRAKAVKNILLYKGVMEHQVSMISYGKEKPAVEGNASEDGHRLNRRAEMHLIGADFSQKS